MIRSSVLIALMMSLSAFVDLSVQQNVQACTICDPNDSQYSNYGTVKVPTTGYEMYLEAAIFQGKAVSQTAYFAQIYGNQNGQGVYYITNAHQYNTIKYDLNNKWSYFLKNPTSGISTCSYQDITGKIGMYGYVHGSDVILLPDKLLDLTNIKINPNTVTSLAYRGIDAKSYTGCVRDNTIGLTLKVTWYFSDNNRWQMEGGATNPSILGMDICGRQDSGTTVTATATMINFHNHLQAVPGSAIYHSLFEPPSDRFCPQTGSAQKPTLIQRYSFRGEYVDDTTRTASPILVAYDSKYNLIRYDFLPIDPSYGVFGFQHSWLQDGTTGVKYNVDLITGHCSAYPLSNNSVVDFTKGAMALVGPDRLKDSVLKNLDLSSVIPCRRMSCDLFIMADSSYLYQYSFVSDSWAEKNAGSVNASLYNVLATVGRTPISGATDSDGDGVDVFDFSDDTMKLWQFEIADVCYKSEIDQRPFNHRWVRLYFKGDHRTLVKDSIAYLRSAMIESIADAAKISAMRTSGLVFDTFRDQLNVEFIIWEPHPVVAGNKPVTLQQAINNLKANVTAGKFVVSVGNDVQGYSLTADPSTFENCDVKCSSQIGADTKLMYTDGFTMGMQIAIYIPPLPPVLESKLPFKTPFKTTYYIEAYHGYADGDQGGHGSLYVYDRHTNYTIVYNEHALESILVNNKDLSCETKDMIYNLTIFPFGYLHGSLPIPLPDVLSDMSRYTQHNLRQRGTSWTHGFKTTVFQAEAEVGELFGVKLPAAIPVNVRWHWLDKEFESEDGRYDQAGPVPISMEAEITIPSIPGFEKYAGGVASAYISVVNYHNHYPDTSTSLNMTKDPVRELLEVPVGVYCEKRIHDTSHGNHIPQMPDLPKRFKMKSETVVKAPYDYVISSEDYFDYNQSYFRYDVAKHNPDKPGLQAFTQVTLDYPKDLYFIIDHDAHTCDHGKISQAGKDDPIMTHILLAPYELLNLDNLNEQFMGIKNCRDMSCYYWVGRRNIDSIKECPGCVGTFEVWSTTLKWHTIEDQLDGKSTAFIKITVTIKNPKGATYLKEEMEIYDMQLLTPKDLADFALPTAAFCRGEGNDPQKITLPIKYSYRGEYVTYDSMTVSAFKVLNDDGYQMFRYDHAPSKAQGDEPAYRSTWLVDKAASLIFDVDRVADTCQVVPNELPSRTDGIWLLIYPETLSGNIGDYAGARACRSKACETFVKSTPPSNQGWTDLETYFTGPNWQEYNSDNPLYVDSNVLTRVGYNGFQKDGSIISSMHQSVDIFSFTKDVQKEWDYRYLYSCFKDGDKTHFRLSITDLDGGSNYPDPTEYFLAGIIATLTGVTFAPPYRFVNLKFKQYSDELRVVFTLVDRHPMDTVGVPLNDAVNSLLNYINGGKAIFQFMTPNLNTGDYESQQALIRSVSACDYGECDIDAERPVTFVFDAATAFGVFFGCFIGGALITMIVLAVVYSRRLRVSVKDVFLMSTPSAPSTASPVNLSGLSYR